jgi:hypothetical protein
MRISRCLLLLAVLGAPLAGRTSAQPPAAAHGFDAYRIVATRNIFDPDRIPTETNAPPPSRVTERPATAVDYVTLTGILVNGGKTLAFFSGSRPDYDKVTGVDGDIAGAKISKITPENIEVNRAGRKIVVAVGQTVPFDGSAPGAPPAVPAYAAPAAAPAGAAGADETSPAATPLPGNLNEVMRRMMERRQQELQ